MLIENRYRAQATSVLLVGLGRRRRLLALVFRRCARRPSTAFVVFLALVTVSILTCCLVVVRVPNARIIISETRNSDIDDDDDILNRTSLDRLLDDFDAAKRQNRTQRTQNYSDDDLRRIDGQFMGLQPLLQSQTAHQAMRPKNSTHLRPSSSSEDRHSIRSDHRSISFSDWLLLQVNRTAQMLETCATFRPSPKRSADTPPARQCGRRLDGIFVDKSRRILYCAIPKVASSSVKLAMALMTGRVNRTAAGSGSSYPVHSSGWLRSVGIFSLDYLVDNDSRWLKAVWSSLRKFLVVRQPVERLVSAYVDKFTLRNRFSDYFQHRYGRRIVRLYRNENTSSGGGAGHDVSFGEFVRFLVDRTIPCVHRSNPHWMTYHDICHPCFIDYDFVVRFENLADEMHHLWHALYRKGSVDDVLPRRNAGKTRSGDLVGRYVDQLPDGYLSGLYDAYEMDFRLFMYSL